MKTDITFIRASIESLSPRSAFDKASKSFSLDLLAMRGGVIMPSVLSRDGVKRVPRLEEYCYGGNGLCTPGTLKRVKNGPIPPP